MVFQSQSRCQGSEDLRWTSAPHLLYMKRLLDRAIGEDREPERGHGDGGGNGGPAGYGDADGGNGGDGASGGDADDNDDGRDNRADR